MIVIGTDDKPMVIGIDKRVIVIEVKFTVIGWSDWRCEEPQP